jgi:hypothetical protein
LLSWMMYADAAYTWDIFAVDTDLLLIPLDVILFISALKIDRGWHRGRRRALPLS